MCFYNTEVVTISEHKRYSAAIIKNEININYLKF